VALPLLAGEEGLEALGVEIEVVDVVAARREPADGRGADRGHVAVGHRMG
jgi:hypothetical protein